MEIYKFNVKKIIENTVQIREESYKKAFRKLLEILGHREAKLLEHLEDNEEFFEIKLTNIYEDFEEETDETIKENVEEIIDDLPKEYNEIVCEQCGNCIHIDENFMS